MLLLYEGYPGLVAQFIVMVWGLWVGGRCVAQRCVLDIRQPTGSAIRKQMELLVEQ